MLKDLVYVIDKAVAIERKSWNMDKQVAGGQHGEFKININVPDPHPPPEEFNIGLEP